jgi:glycine/D-amino acid oxidase-like deaminating enzyme
VRKQPAAVDAAIARSLADARPVSYWLDQPDAPEPMPALAGTTSADLAIVGGGFTGLWTALLAKERDPSCDVVLLEAKSAGHAASGRNGGFCSASLTHGIANGLERFPQEMPLLERLGAENLEAIAATVVERGIDCDFQLTGELSVATERWQLEGAADDVANLPGVRPWLHRLLRRHRDRHRRRVAPAGWHAPFWH